MLALPKNILLLLVCLTTYVSQAQFKPISENAHISLLTCGSGDEMYSLFGHSAIRVQDRTRGIDWVFNYGMFDFNTPNFSVKFVRGKLEYHMGCETFDNFLYPYQVTKRSVFEQVLDLNQTQQQAIYAFLVDNLNPDKKFYKYDFFYDNCSSRLRDVLQKNIGDELVFAPTVGDSSFRDYINPYIKKHPWIDFGMNITLGYQSDVIAKDGKELFLPNKLKEGFDKATINEKPLVKTGHWLYNPPSTTNYSGTISPTLLSFLILVIVLIMTVQPSKFRKIAPSIDVALRLLAGLMGLLFLLMWLFTDHQTTYANMNLLWASPLYLIVLILAAFKRNNGQVVKYVYAFITAGTFISLVFGAFFPQDIHFSAYPLMLALLIRLAIIIQGYRKIDLGEAAN